MGKIKSPRPGYPDLMHPAEFAAAAGFSEPHYYKLVRRKDADGRPLAPETCSGIPRKVAMAWLQRRAAAAIKRKVARAKKKVAATAPVPAAGPSANAPCGDL